MHACGEDLDSTDDIEDITSKRNTQKKGLTKVLTVVLHIRKGTTKYLCCKHIFSLPFLEHLNPDNLFFFLGQLHR